MERSDQETSFDAFMRARAPSLMRYGYALTGNWHDAADLVQEALARVGARWARVHGRGNPEQYVRTTMARLHVSWWRRRRREWLVGSVPERPYVDSALARADVRGELWQALSALPARQRAVLVLRYYEHCSDAEISSVLGISRGTVRSQASRGLDRLRGSWAPTDVRHQARASSATAPSTQEPAGPDRMIRRQA
jgi:RNA polymerase sigma-70 factor (sigma-E family)